ncbi:MAG: RNA polymerase sigma factor [Bacteroidales bacterium]|nr:RNA polymerase sigma factor [Bacteroidales bacterium]
MTINEYNRCVDEFSDAVYRFLLKNSRNVELARDLVQDSFLKLWLKRKGIDYNKSKSYLFTTAYHTLIDHVRKLDNRQTENDYELDTAITEHGYSDLKEILDFAVDKLPAIQRSVVLLRDYEGYSYKEIGEITELTEAQVKVYIYRARLFLKKFIGRPEMVI